MAENGKVLFRDVKVEWTFSNRLMAGVPADPAVIAAWLETRGLADKMRETMAEVGVDENAVVEKTEAAKLVFKRDGVGLYVCGYCTKAHLKDCANQLAKILEIKMLRSKLANAVYVVEDVIHIYRPCGNPTAIRKLPMQQADGEYEHAIQVMTRQGPRSALMV